MVSSGERMTEKCGTPAYIAPEILQNKGYEGFAVDIWSAGVVLFAMVYGTVPFKASSMPELHKLILKGKYTLKPSASEDVRDLLKKMLEVDPKKRWTIPQILCHRWFSDYNPAVEVFTFEEKEKIKGEFTYNQRANRNQPLGEGPISTIDSDWFIEQSIDASQSDLTRNVSTKSVILAPFNSTLSHQSDSQDAVEPPVVDRRVVRFASKVKDVDRVYERNNNSKIDNGVYNDCSYDTQNSEVLMELDPFGGNGSFEDDHKEEEKNEPDIKIHEDIRRTVQQMLLNSLKPRVLTIGNYRNLILDKEIVKKVGVLGYPEEYVVRSLKEGERNYATTTYFLISN